MTSPIEKDGSMAKEVCAPVSSPAGIPRGSAPENIGDVPSAARASGTTGEERRAGATELQRGPCVITGCYVLEPHSHATAGGAEGVDASSPVSSRVLPQGGPAPLEDGGAAGVVGKPPALAGAGMSAPISADAGATPAGAPDLCTSLGYHVCGPHDIAFEIALRAARAMQKAAGLVAVRAARGAAEWRHTSEARMADNIANDIAALDAAEVAKEADAG